MEDAICVQDTKIGNRKLCVGSAKKMYVENTQKLKLYVKTANNLKFLIHVHPNYYEN